MFLKNGGGVVMLNNRVNKAHVNKIRALGNKSLGLQIRVKKNRNQKTLLGNVKEFLGFLSSDVYFVYDQWVVDYSNTLKIINENDDVLKSLIDCIKCLRQDDIVEDEGSEDNSDENSTNKFIKLREIYGDDYGDDYGDNNGDWKLLIQKTFLILKLIKFGINPFKIKKYLEQDDADGNSFNWDKLIKTLLDLNWYVKKINNLDILDYCVGNHNNIIALIKLINFMDPILFPMDPDLDGNGDAESALNFLNDSDLYRGVRVNIIARDFLLLALHYVNNKDMNEPSNEELKNFLESYISDNMLSDKAKSWLKDDFENNLIIYSSYMSNEPLSKNLEKDFWVLAERLDPTVFCAFVMIMMKDISFTDSQMVRIRTKINNEQMFARLQKLNRNYEYKSQYCYDEFKFRYLKVKLGAVTSLVDKCLLKTFRGIGYLGAFLLTLAIASLFYVPAFGVSYLLMLSPIAFIPFGSVIGWSIYTALVLTATVVLFVSIFTDLHHKIRNWFEDFSDKMGEYYDKTVGYLLQLFNLRFPTNNIPPFPKETVTTETNVNPIDININTEAVTKLNLEERHVNNDQNGKEAISPAMPNISGKIKGEK